MAAYLACFIGGLAGSFHCVGMCGGFALALAAPHRNGLLLRQVLYNLGRLNTLVFIGALSGGFGAAVVASGPGHSLGQLVAIVAGALMIVIGLENLGLIARMSTGPVATVQRGLSQWLGAIIRSRTLAAPIALGVLNAFLPCQLIYAFAARAVGTASMREGALTMLWFGLGTVPAMLAVGTSAAIAGPSVRARLVRGGGYFIIAFGVFTMLRAFDGMWTLLHHHAH